MANKGVRKEGISHLPFILQRQQKQLQPDDWKPLTRFSHGEIDWHKVIFYAAYALGCIHENERAYNNISIDDVFVYCFDRGESPIYKLLERDTAALNPQERCNNWKSFAEFMLAVLHFATYKTWPVGPVDQEDPDLLSNHKFCLKIVTCVLRDAGPNLGFLKVIPEYILIWYKCKANLNKSFIFNQCICCMNQVRGTLDEPRNRDGCNDACTGYYCDDCLTKSNVKQFCPHHGPRTKGLPFWCSRCKSNITIFHDWYDHSDCETRVLHEDATLNIGTWNVTKLNYESDLIWILLEMEKLNVDIMGVSETKWNDPGISFEYNLLDKKYYIITSNESDPHYPKGVAWIVRERGYKIVVQPSEMKSNRIVSIALRQDVGPNLTLTQIYAPPNKSNKNDRDKQISDHECQETFYESMNKLTDHSIIAGDFNEAINNGEYCCFPKGTLLSDFCCNNGFVVSNIWPSDKEPVTKAKNDFILMKSILWLERCALSSKKFCAVYKSDHLFPVVASLKIDEISFLQIPTPITPIKQGIPIRFHMTDMKKKDFKEWYDRKKDELRIEMDNLKALVRSVLYEKDIPLKSKNTIFKHPSARLFGDSLVESVSGRLLELSFSSCMKDEDIEVVSEEDKKLLEVVFEGNMETGHQKLLIQGIRKYKNLIHVTILEARSKYNAAKRRI